MIQSKDLFDKYNDIYTQSFVLHPHESGDGYNITLTENDLTAGLRKLVINNVPKNTSLIALQQYSDLGLGNKMKSILNDAPGIFKCCDYLIITIVDNKLHLIFVEIKSEKINPSDIIKQFKGASCFIDYCNSIMEYFYNSSPLQVSNLNPRYVLISGKKLNKTSTKQKRFGAHSSPEIFNHCKVSVDNNKTASITFGKLL